MSVIRVLSVIRMLSVTRILTRVSTLSGWLIASALLHAQAPLFTIQDLGSLPDLPDCSATALSQSGNVMGYCLNHGGQSLASNPTTHAFLYSKGVMKDLSAVSESTAIGTAVNDSGSVVGFLLNRRYRARTAGSRALRLSKWRHSAAAAGCATGNVAFRDEQHRAIGGHQLPDQRRESQFLHSKQGYCWKSGREAHSHHSDGPGGRMAPPRSE